MAMAWCHLQSSRPNQWTLVPGSPPQFADITDTDLEVRLNCFLVIEVSQICRTVHTPGGIFTNWTHSCRQCAEQKIEYVQNCRNVPPVSFQVIIIPTKGNRNPDYQGPLSLVWFLDSIHPTFCHRETQFGWWAGLLPLFCKMSWGEWKQKN